MNEQKDTANSNTDETDPADLVALAQWALVGLAAGSEHLSGHENARRAAAAILGLDEPVGAPAVKVVSICSECEGLVDLSTRQHVEGDDQCSYNGGLPPGYAVETFLCCPVCDAAEIGEVNVGEIWDVVASATLAGGILTLTISQCEEMDREGDGWVCLACGRRLRLPDDVAFDFEYE